MLLSEIASNITVHDGPNGRFYHVPMWSPVNQRYTNDYVHILPSVTTILSQLSAEGIAAWRDSIGHDEADAIVNTARYKGTALHALVEKYVRGDPIDYLTENPIIVEDFRSIQPIIDKNLTKVVAVEIPLWSIKLQTAGRADLIGIWNGVLSIVDFKTARKEKKRKYIIPYFLQATCYALMYNELYDADIDDFQIVMAVKQDIPQVFSGKVSKYKPWVERLFIEERNDK